MAADSTTNIRQAAEWIAEADALLIGTGAGMGVASGIGTFRGINAGVWPPLARRGIDFSEMSNPQQFLDDEQFAWSFWRFRYLAYTQNDPNEGYAILNRWSREKTDQYQAHHATDDTASIFRAFSFTSNIDGHWIACGFPETNVHECHGSVRYMQCQGRPNQCANQEIWPAEADIISALTVDETTDRVDGQLPCCPQCHKTARPNVMMFGDWSVICDRIDEQSERMDEWTRAMKEQDAKIAIVELGAGVAVPTVRATMESYAKRFGAPLIRINPEYPSVPASIKRSVSITLGAVDALRAIDAELDRIKAGL